MWNKREEVMGSKTLYNEEIHNLYSAPNANKVIKSRIKDIIYKYDKNKKNIYNIFSLSHFYFGTSNNIISCCKHQNFKSIFAAATKPEFPYFLHTHFIDFSQF
jgi:hypothetical protein